MCMKKQGTVIGWLVGCTAKVISWRSVTHICFLVVLTQLFFPKPPTTFLTCFCRGERRKEGHLNRGSNSQPPGHESDMLTTEPPGRGSTVAGERYKHLSIILISPKSLFSNQSQELV